MPNDKPVDLLRTPLKLGISREDALTTGGLLFMLVSLLCISFQLLLLRNLKQLVFISWTELFADLSSPVLMFISGVVAFLFGFSLLRAAGTATKQVIPPQDADVLKPMLRDGNSVGIGEYIRLSSLTGFIGGFTKLGLSGLPLATIGLTILFALMGLKSDKLYDLAKLTLGAFLGSYVQRQVSDVQRRANETTFDVQSQLAEVKKQIASMQQDAPG